MTTRDVRVTQVAREHGEALAALFARADVTCHCRYWHFADTTNAWLARSAHAPELNREEMRAALDAGNDDMLGVVAQSEGAIVGWLKLAPAETVPKLYERRPYRRLPCFDGDRVGVYAIGCLLVDPSRRKHGIAAALLEGAVELAERRGARTLEAFPRRAEGTRDEEVWMGPFSLFERAGFDIVNDLGPYPVLRKVLTPRSEDAGGS